jgi:hypothetical protein
MALGHFNIATEGIRSGHKYFAKLGFGFGISIVVSLIPKAYTQLGGGSTVGFANKKQVPYPTIMGMIRIIFKDKEQSMLFYNVINMLTADIKVEFIRRKVTEDDTIFNIVLNKLKRSVQKPIIKIKEIL